MKTTTWVIALAIVCATGVQAQERTAPLQAGAKGQGCMMMSDSTITVLGLTAQQIAQVQESDARCAKVCGGAGGTTMHQMDPTAMATHDAEIEKILSAEQYARWSKLCNTSKVEIKADPTQKN